MKMTMNTEKENATQMIDILKDAAVDANRGKVIDASV
jgi:hypothetical protein